MCSLNIYVPTVIGSKQNNVTSCNLSRDAEILSNAEYADFHMSTGILRHIQKLVIEMPKQLT